MDGQQLTLGHGLCECGCGRSTTIWRGKARRYIQGHSGQLRPRAVDLDGAWSVDAESGCWLWQRGIHHSGYAFVARQLAHRYVYELHRGPIPEGLTLDHLCRVRHCVNPEHLEPVTMTENLRRGRVAKVTVDQVRAMRSRVASGEMTITEAGLAYGVTYFQAWNIVRRKSWKDVA
jgi:hypothetical protein